LLQIDLCLNNLKRGWLTSLSSSDKNLIMFKDEVRKSDNAGRDVGTGEFPQPVGH